MQGFLSTLSWVLIVTGLLLMADAAATLVWQEPASALIAKLRQDALSDDLRELEQSLPTDQQQRALTKLATDEKRIAFLARALDRKVSDGDAIGRIKIPKIDVSKVVVEGTEAADLRKGPGHYAKTPMPGVPGTAAIAGHRTTYGAPFRKVDKLKRGDEIELTMPYARFTYEVERTQIVAPTAIWVTRRVSYDRLVLSACHPVYSAAKRIIVFARLTDVEPRGAALRARKGEGLRRDQPEPLPPLRESPPS